MQAIGQDHSELSDMELTDELSKVANVEIPAAIDEIRNAPVRHKTLCQVDEMPAVVRGFLGIK
jgi:threonine synthase